MFRPDLATRPTPALADAPAAVRPTPALGGTGGAGFGALFGAVRADVEDFIENGAPASPAAMSAGSDAAPSGAAGESAASAQEQREFLASIAPLAQEAGQRLGVSPDLVSAQAALETGWGRKPLRRADGGDTNNLFGMKATGAWQGDVAAARTTEQRGGVPVATIERFRAYPDAASAFRDHTQLLLDNPRYRGALNTGSDAHAFAQGLARGGYATDPAYADKLARLATRIQSGE
jgi:flagellar protein FlgJ